jgi:hypothetical protein
LEVTYQEMKELLQEQADICRATLPMLSVNDEKTVDENGLEFLMAGFLYLYDDYTGPSDEQFSQLQQTAAACAETYRDLMARPAKDLDGDETALLNLSNGFLMLYSFKVSNDRSKMN